MYVRREPPISRKKSKYFANKENINKILPSVQSQSNNGICSNQLIALQKSVGNHVVQRMLSNRSTNGSIQRTVMPEEELQMKEETPKKGSNGAMPELVQSKMETALNSDFSNVNIHEGSRAKDVGALAYTQGNDIHFAPGQYQPETQKGQELLGHELTHVIQQRAGRVHPTTQAKGIPVNDDPGLEKEADDIGKKAANQTT